MKKINSRILTITAFMFFSAWLLSFAYEGQILYSLLDGSHIESRFFIMVSIFVHAVGLLVCRFISTSISSAKKVMLISAAVCLLCSAVFFSPSSYLWMASLVIASFFAGLWNASWGWFYRYTSTQKERMKTAAFSVAFGTALMVFLNVIAINANARHSLALAMFCLIASLCAAFYLPKSIPDSEDAQIEENKVALRRPFTLICLFIVVITFGSGFMFQVINPAFSHLTVLTSWYWAVPYIAAMIAVALLPRRISRSYILYISLSMLGFGFIAFEVFDNSALSYIIINTLILGAFGITDLFIWSILGEMSQYSANPVKIFGTGLSINVFSVLLGEVISLPASASSGGKNISLLGLTVVIIAFTVLPPLFRQLNILLKYSAFLSKMEALPEKKKEQIVEAAAFPAGLSEREMQIVRLILKGYTYSLIAKELYISVSTVKTHIHNIYDKLNVSNKTELIQKMM